MSDEVSRSNAPPRPADPMPPERFAEWLAFELDPLIARRAELIAALEACVAAHPEIGDDKVQALFAENVALVQALQSEAKARHDEIKRPYFAISKVVDDWLRTKISEPLSGPLMIVGQMMTDYANAKLRASREAAEKVASEAREAAARAAQAAADAVARRDAGTKNPLRAQMQAADAITAAELAAKAAARAEAAVDAPPADHTRVRGEYGAVASVHRGRWKWRVADAGRVPAQYWILNNDLIERDLYASGKAADGRPKGTIRGIEVYREDGKVRVRT